MKKQFTTVINITAAEYATMIFSASKIGHQVELAILDEIATKYNGEVHIDTRENMFDIKVSMQA